MNFRKTAVAGIKWTSLGTIGRALFQLLQISILTRFLPKEAFGLVAMALFLVQFSNIFVDMGMTSAILHRQNATKNEYSSIYWLNIVISVLLYFLLLLGAPVAAQFYDEPQLSSLIPILGLNLLIMASGRQHRTIMQKQFEFEAIAKIELVSFFIGLLSAVLFAYYDFGVYSLVYSTLISSFISNSLFLILNMRLNPISFHFKLQETKPFLKIGGFSMGSALLDFFSRESDVLIIGKLLGAESLGVYSLAKQIVLRLFSIINPIIINVLNPLFSSIQKEKKRLKLSFLKVIKYFAYINFPIYMFVIIASKEILQILYGDDYSNSYAVLSFLAFAYCITALANPVGSLQIATGRTDLGFKWTIIRVVATPIVIYLGALKNIETVAICYALLSLVLVLPLWHVQIKPMAGIPLREYVSQFYKPFSFFILATLLILLFGDKMEFYNSPFISLVLKGIITVVSYGFYIYLIDRSSIKDTYEFITSSFKSNK